jgi:cyclic lactone autoinducer peptide
MFDIKTYTGNVFVLYNLRKKGDFIMLKFLAKVAEKYASATNTACKAVWVFHQPKMPASLIKKD